MTLKDALIASKLSGDNGGGGGGASTVPVFTAIYDPDTWEVTGATCDKTWSECKELYDNGVMCAVLYYDDPDSPIYDPLSCNGPLYHSGGGTALWYVDCSNGVPYIDINYEDDGTINVQNPSAMIETLNATQNGTYYPAAGVFKEVTVNVN